MRAPIFLFVLTSILIAITAQSTNPMYEIYFHNVPEKYMPTIASDYIGAKGSCDDGYRLRTKSVITIPNEEGCEFVGFISPAVKTNSFKSSGPVSTKTDAPVCDASTKTCTQVLTTELQKVECEDDPFDHDNHQSGDIMMTLELSATCNGINRKLGIVGAKIQYDYSSNNLHRLSQGQGYHNKRDVSMRMKRSPSGTVALGGSCSTSNDCSGPTCARNCSGGICVAVVNDAYCTTQYTSAAAGISPCLLGLYCNTSLPEYAYGGVASGTGCTGNYSTVGTSCTFVTEPGPAYGTAVGICQGGYEGYCFSNNQIGLLGDQSETTKSDRVADIIDYDSKTAGDFNEGGFDIFAGSDRTDPVRRRKELRHEESDRHTEPWLHANDEDAKLIVGLLPTYPIDHDLVDDDTTNDAAALTAITTGGVNANVSALYDSNGNALPYCSGESFYTASPRLNGTYITPRYFDFLHNDDDDTDNDEGAVLDGSRLKGNGTGFCTPVCYAKNITYKGIHKLQIYACTRGYFAIAGDHGTKATRRWSVWSICVVLAVIAFYVIAYHMRIVLAEAGRMRVSKISASFKINE